MTDRDTPTRQQIQEALEWWDTTASKVPVLMWQGLDTIVAAARLWLDSLCDNCGGTGIIKGIQGGPHGVAPWQKPCPSCGGTGKPAEQPHLFDPWKVKAVWYGTDPPTVFTHGNLIEVDHGIGQVLIESEPPVVTEAMIEQMVTAYPKAEEARRWGTSQDAMRVLLRAALEGT